MLNIVDADGLDITPELLAGRAKVCTRSDAARRVRLFPLLRAEGIVAASYEQDARDIDVAALHQGWLKAAKAAGSDDPDGGPSSRKATIAKGRGQSRRKGRASLPASRQRRRSLGRYGCAGLRAAPIGLQPMRRTMAVLPMPPENSSPLAACRATPPKAGIPSPKPAACRFRRTMKSGRAA